MAYNLVGMVVSAKLYDKPQEQQRDFNHSWSNATNHNQAASYTAVISPDKMADAEDQKKLVSKRSAVL